MSEKKPREEASDLLDFSGPEFDHIKIALEQQEEKENTESTQSEWREKLRGLVDKFPEGAKEVKEKIEKAKEYLTNRSTELGNGLKKIGLDVVGDFKAAGEGIAHMVANPAESFGKIKTGAEKAKDYASYFADRSKTLDEKGEKLKTDLKKLVEGYNKLPFRQKAYITASLIGGGALATAAGLPPLASTLAGLMYGQRVLGGAGFALKRREKMEEKLAVNKDATYFGVKLEGRSDKFKNTYAAVLGAVYMGGTAIAGRYAMEKLSDWLGHAFGHTTVVPAATQNPSYAYETPLENPYAYEVAGVSAIQAAPEIPVTSELPVISVDASSGHGYEYMAKQLWNKVHESGFVKPPNLDPDSDLAKLINSDENSINKLVHDLAEKHEFFDTATGKSIQINLDDTMTLDAHGNIEIDTTGSVEDHWTPAYHPETPVTPLTETPVSAPVTEPPPAGTSSSVQEPTSPEYPGPHSTVPPAEKIPEAPPAAPAPEAPAPRPETQPTPPVETVSATHPEAPIAPPPETQEHTAGWSEAARNSTYTDSIINNSGLEVSISEPHIYADAVGKHLLAFGGSTTEQANVIQNYLIANPDKIVYSTADNSGMYRIPWGFVDGKVIPVGTPVRTGGFFGFFKSFMKAPEPDELGKLIQ
ncbi:MAG: hypothetical protein NTU85_01490 [Candidatus Kaiserbacteria bacterium]|nr:hypothetical protein [Candidatus Kaiserbacteria bacterium]